MTTSSIFTARDGFVFFGERAVPEYRAVALRQRLVTMALADFSREATVAEAALAEAQDEIRRWKRAARCLTLDGLSFADIVRDTIADYGLDIAAASTPVKGGEH
ncbi:MAG: hypothetical protein J7521_20200 [Caulobacter sp.]|nr:hypothetical protein [Caulobacter sp.]